MAKLSAVKVSFVGEQHIVLVEELILAGDAG